MYQYNQIILVVRCGSPSVGLTRIRYTICSGCVFGKVMRALEEHVLFFYYGSLVWMRDAET